MKKLLFIALVSALLVGIRLNSYSQVLEGPPRDGVFDRQALPQQTPIPYVYLREADIVWTKRIWRVIDMREKMNQPFYYPEQPQNNWRSFVQILMDGIKEGTITAYSVNSDQFLYPITYKELMDKLETPQKFTLKRPDNPDITYDTVITKPFYASDVKKLRLKEDWFFDKQRSVFEVRILGICPVMDNYDEKGEYRGDEPLFWIYFPECRSTFVRNEMFNPKNGYAGRLNYDDVFTKRIFESYVYKEENVYDRSISEYATGVDALMESEKAKATLFEFEEGLWEF
jgi:gliding motility associated protien GldN